MMHTILRFLGFRGAVCDGALGLEHGEMKVFRFSEPVTLEGGKTYELHTDGHTVTLYRVDPAVLWRRL